MSQKKDSEQMELLGPAPEKQKMFPTPFGLSANQGQGDGEFGKAIRNWSSPEDSPARISVTPANKPESMVKDQGYGKSLPVLLARYDRPTRSWRTSQRCLVETEADGFSEFLETWPRSGMTVNGTAYLLQPLARLTAGTESGLLPTHSTWPTPQARDFRSVTGREHLQRDNAMQNLNVAAVYSVRWPTPKGSPSGPDFARMNRKGSGGDDLATAVARWPTPTSRDWKDGSAKSCANVPENGLLGRVATRGTETGSLNPQWVEWLMGYPEGWTDLED